jgi:hypothetical protein
MRERLAQAFRDPKRFAITSPHLRIWLAAPEHISNSKAMSAIVGEVCDA